MKKLIGAIVSILLTFMSCTTGDEALLKAGIDDANQDYPEIIDEGLTIERIEIIGGYVTYIVSVDEEQYKIKTLQENIPNLKESIVRKVLLSGDYEMLEFARLCKKAKKGLAYSYEGNHSGEKAVVKIPCSEL